MKKTATLMWLLIAVAANAIAKDADKMKSFKVQYTVYENDRKSSPLPFMSNIDTVVVAPDRYAARRIIEAQHDGRARTWSAEEVR